MLMENVGKEQMLELLTSHYLIQPSWHDFLGSRSSFACQFHFLNLVNHDADTQISMLTLNQKRFTVFFIPDFCPELGRMEHKIHSFSFYYLTSLIGFR